MADGTPVESTKLTVNLDEIYGCLCQIQSLAQIIQSATEKNGDDKTGLYGTASVIDEIADRAIKLTGV